MTDLNKTFTQIKKLTSDLITLSLCNAQNFPIIRNIPGRLTEVTYSNECNLNVVLKNQDYKEIYDELNRLNAFNLKMLDGALIQLMYIFDEYNLKKHRLAFFPSPYLYKFQNDPDIYELDEIYADIIAKNIVPFPFRFDFDSKDISNTNFNHPKSHLTLGQYKNCRIPVTAPLTPYHFIHFMLNNFYNTAYEKYFEKINQFDDCFPDTIIESERDIIHVQIPIKG